VARRRGAAIQRLLHVGDDPVLVGVVQVARDLVRFGARARTEAAAEEAIARLRFATCVDEDLRPFHDAFRDDPVIGRAVRSRPQVRVWRRPDPWEALAWAVTEQLIELERAAEIQRRMVRVLGRRCSVTGLRDVPTPAAVAGTAPARLESFGLAGRRALTLRRAAREVAAGRVDLHAHDQSRLSAIPGIGRWTLEMLAVSGQGRHDVVPAGDLGFLKVVGRLRTGNPRARADEDEVREFFEPYGRWKALAGSYLFYAASTGMLPLRVPRPSRGPAPRPAGTRSSAPVPRSAAA